MQILSEKKYVSNEFENVAYFEPFYLKNCVATIPKNKILK
jgi:tRNA threonylcarbamoyladenosine biosynthesis protein TsaB